MFSSRETVVVVSRLHFNQLAKQSIIIMSVTIVGLKQVETGEGKVFTSLEIQGDVKLVQSETTGNYYLSAFKTRVSTALSFEFCQTLIGTKLPGTIEKVDCDPYEYVNKETGETMTLFHSYIYSPKEVAPVQQQQFNPYAGIGQQYYGQHANSGDTPPVIPVISPQ